MFGLGRGLGKYGYNPKLTPWIKENARRFDAVILHGLWNYSSAGAWRGLKNQSTPYFIFVHGMMDPWFRDSYPIKHVFKSVYWQLCQGRGRRDAASVLFTSEEECERARGMFYGPSYQERIVRYGIPGPSSEEQVQRRIHFWILHFRTNVSFYTLAGFIPRKGCDLLLQGLLRLSKIAPEFNLQLPDRVHRVICIELKRLASELQISDRIHWLGMLVAASGAQSVQRKHLFCPHQENFGIAVAEAMTVRPLF